ncbi:ATPase [Clostridium sp. C105KSO13]|uniref:ATPase n=1 Tax=Clostridium sp. C105KSO13 TaxID=1776045 RepID=UPI000740777E|nr:ATPase [Clostridium sp. C105KSO13]CUX32045.1 V-type ATP synthase subunit H [Clostridium sp. C105KSO13]
MVEETIQAIRETEANAGAIVNDADEKCRKMLEDAYKEAERLKAKQRDTALKEADAVMETARMNGEEFQKAAAASIENEIKLLRETASKREEEAISLTVSRLV